MRRRHLLWSAGAALVLVLILWKVPQWEVGQLKDLNLNDRFDKENEARKTIATILGGIVVLAGAFATWRNLKLAQEGHITDRFTKAIEQLGATYGEGKKKLEVRLGGIYALERIANDSERDHWTIIEVLSTYVRENALVSDEVPPAASTPSQARHPPADIQAILTVLGRRNRQLEVHPGSRIVRSQEVEYRRLELPRTALRGARLEEADLGEANLSGSDLSRTILWGANLSGANLSHASLFKANLGSAYLYDANLSEANLSGANLNRATLTDALLFLADLSEVDLTETVGLTQGQIDVAKGDFSTKLPARLQMPESWKK